MEKEAKQYNENRKNNGKTSTTTIKKNSYEQQIIIDKLALNSIFSLAECKSNIRNKK